MSRNERSIRQLRDLQSSLNVGEQLALFLQRATSGTIVDAQSDMHHTWWQSVDGSQFVQGLGLDDFIRKEGQKEINKRFPVAGFSLNPITVDDELLTLRRTNPTYVAGAAVTELVGLDKDDIFSVVGAKRVYGFAEEKMHPALEVPGGHPLTDKTSRSLAVVFNLFASEYGIKPVQFKP